MSRLLIIGCGGVASVAIRKCCQNSQVFDEIMKTNEFSEKFSLRLSENNAKEIMKTRNEAFNS